MDKEYLKLLEVILRKGEWMQSRNSRTLQIPFYSFSINAKDWLLSLRKMNYKGVKGEFKTLMDTNNLLTNVSQFEANSCPYWKLWAKENGSLNLDYYNQLHNQFEDVIEQIKKDPFSRRHVVSLWNHDNVKSNSLSLVCCWYSLTFVRTTNAIDLVWTQRSTDTYYGLPADVYLARQFLEHVSNETNIPMGDIHFSLSNVHLYENQVKAAKELLVGKEPSYRPELIA